MRIEKLKITFALIIALAMSFSMVHVHAMEYNERFEYLRIEDGLSQSVVYAIAQDKGFAALEGNTVRVEHTSKKLSIEDARKLIEEARNQIQQGEVNVTAEHVNVTANEVTDGNEPNETELS